MRLNGRLILFSATVLALAGAVPRLAAQARYTSIDFVRLSDYNYNEQDPYDPTPFKTEGTIPGTVTSLDGKKVRIQGNAMALDYSSGFMTEFLLHPTVDACEYGATPRINEWIHVKLPAGQKVKIFTGYAVEIKGTFFIREEIERGRVVGLYQILADSVRGR